MAHKAPKVDPVSWVIFIISSLSIVAVVYVLLSNLVSTYQRNSTKGEIDSSQLILKVEENLKPIGISSTSDTPVASAAGRDGKEIYDAVCSSCHATGVLGSPKFGDKAAWEARATNGLAGLLTSATNGKGSMPAKGGDPTLSDAELKAVVLYMTNESGLSLGEAIAEKKEAPKTEAKTTEKAEEKPAVTIAPTLDKAPVVPVAPIAAKAPAAPAIDGKKIYNSACFACHATGVAGSPKIGDKAAWEARIATGMDALYTTALKGKGAMPPKGGNMSLDDNAVKAAVDYMVEQSK